MKIVTAIIRPQRLDNVVDALEAIGVNKLTVTDARGVGRTPAPGRVLPEAPLAAQLPARTEIEIAIPSEQVAKVIEVIRAASASGKAGDGKIFVTELERAVRIRTGETGEQAL